MADSLGYGKQEDIADKSKIDFGALARKYGPSAALGLYIEEMAPSPDDPLPEGYESYESYFSEAGDIPESSSSNAMKLLQQFIG